MRQRDRRDYCERLFGCLKHFLSEPSLLIGAHLVVVPSMSRSERPETGGELFFSEEFTGDDAASSSSSPR